MDRLSTLAIVLVLLATPIVAQTAPSDGAPNEIMSAQEFDSRLGFHSTLESLNDLIQEQQSIESVANKIVIFPATVRSVIVRDPDPQNFYAELELVTGEWERIDSVSLYRGYLILIGSYFADTVTERPPRNPDPNLVYEGKRILVAGQVAQIGPDDAGNPVPIIVAYDVRVLD